MPVSGFGKELNFVFCLLFILIAFAFAITPILAKTKKSHLFSLVSFSAALLALLFQFFDYAQVMFDNDVILILDVYIFMPKAYGIFIVLIIALNITAYVVTKRRSEEKSPKLK